MKTRTLTAFLLLAILCLGFAFPDAILGAGTVSTQTLSPVSYTTLAGDSGGQPVSNLAVKDQSNRADDPAKYVTFTTPSVAYDGYRTYLLPGSIPPSSLVSLQVKVNYKGMPKSKQTWTWYLYDWAQSLWVKLGNNAPARNNVWVLISFNVTSPSRFVNGSGEMRLSLRSSNSSGDAKLDYEAIIVKYTQTPTPTPTVDPGNAIIIDHASTDINLVPDNWLAQAREHVAFVYGHTSHGSQLVSGAEYLRDYVDNSRYNLLVASYDIPVQPTPFALRIGDDGGWSWNEDAYLEDARAHLNSAGHASEPGQIRIFMWSWCGEQSSNSVETVQHYLQMMTQLESEYPGVLFVYMTGHTDSGNADILNRNNDLIRDYVRANGKVLYDFADIESWLPDGTPVENPNDSCPWCESWCAAHPDQCQNLPSCAHSHGFNCVLKGRAFWWLSSRLAGWNGLP